MKLSFASEAGRRAGPPPMMRHRPSQTSRPEPPTNGRWLATLAADPNAVREAALATLSELRAELAYLYHADDRAIIRAIDGDGEHQIRVEITPLDPRSTRIVVTCTREGEVDRALSTRIVRAVEARLPSEA